jgi:hypothetical protein
MKSARPPGHQDAVCGEQQTALLRCAQTIVYAWGVLPATQKSLVYCTWTGVVYIVSEGLFIEIQQFA